MVFYRKYRQKLTKFLSLLSIYSLIDTFARAVAIVPQVLENVYLMLTPRPFYSILRLFVIAKIPISRL